MNKILDKHIKEDAKTLVDSLFQTMLFKPDITRDDMNKTEKFVEYLITRRFELYLKEQEKEKRRKKIPVKQKVFKVREY